MHQLAPLLELGISHLPGVVASRAVLERFRQMPDGLPSIFTIGTFECRLDDDERIDFQACAPRSAGAHAVARRWLSKLDDADLRSRGHHLTADLLREWIDPATILGSDIAAVWVEIDFAGAGDMPWPFPFFTLTPPWMRSEPRPIDRTTALVDAGLGCLMRGRLDRKIHAQIHTCLRALPPQASLFHVAMRPMPGGDVVRLIAGTPWNLVPEFLERMDWPESIAHMQRFLERYCEDTVINSIQLDISDRLGPRLGVEFYWPTSPKVDPRWSSLFDKLVADGACTPERRAGVCAWSGCDRLADGDLLSRELLVKVVYEIGKPLRAKAYLPYGRMSDVMQAGVFAKGQETAPAGA